MSSMSQVRGQPALTKTRCASPKSRAEGVMIVRSLNHYNWAQGLEGVIDSSHTNLLHQDNVRPAAVADGVTIQSDNFTSRRPSCARPSTRRA